MYLHTSEVHGNLKNILCFSLEILTHLGGE
jgi:hypothetical protein